MSEMARAHKEERACNLRKRRGAGRIHEMY